MPEAREEAPVHLGPWERAGNAVMYFFLGVFVLGVGILTMGLYLGVPVGLFYFIVNMGITEVVVNTPRECFDLDLDCQVIEVQHSFAPAKCRDTFTYEWSLSNSPVVYKQSEKIVRALHGGECPTLDVGQANATFQVGTNTCFVVKDLFARYAKNFTCGEVVSLNGGTKGACQTLLLPSTDLDPSGSRGLGIAATVILAMGFYCLCAMCLEYRRMPNTPQEDEEAVQPRMGSRRVNAPSGYGGGGTGGPF